MKRKEEEEEERRLSLEREMLEKRYELDKLKERQVRKHTPILYTFPFGVLFRIRRYANLLRIYSSYHDILCGPPALSH